MFIDASGRIYVGTRNAGVEMLDPAHGRTQLLRSDAASITALSDDSIYAFAQDPGGRVWIGTASGLDRLDPDSGLIEQFGPRLRAAALPAGAALKVNALHDDARGSLWIGLDCGLARYDAASATFTLLQHRQNDPNSLPEGRITAILEDDEQRLWIGTTAGLALLDRRTGQVSVLQHDPANGASLPDNNIKSLYQDRTGLLWVGTQTGGVARWNPRSWSFGHHRFAETSSDNITSFAVDGHGRLWVGSFEAGVAAIDTHTGVIARYRQHSKSPLALHDDHVMALAVDQRSRIWIGTMGSGIDRLDLARGSVTHFPGTPADPTALPSAGVMSLMCDARGRIWVGTFGGGLAMIDPDTDRVTRFAYGGSGASELSGDRATAIAEDRTGLIWIGTDAGGLNLLDPASGRFAHFMHDAHNPASLSANTVYALHVDDRGIVWVGTRGGGLDRVVGAPFASGSLRFENISEPDGLPNSTVYGIESDATGRLWLSTNRGLAALQPSDRSISGFRRSHGLQGDEFNFGAHYRAADGMLYFGGANGYNAFLPERLKFNDRPPRVVLTDILKLNTPSSQTPEQLHDLDVGFGDAAVTFRFAALDFTGPAENRYAYRLDGFDSDWVNAGSNRQATYTNLAGGNYVFRVARRTATAAGATSRSHWRCTSPRPHGQRGGRGPCTDLPSSRWRSSSGTRSKGACGARRPTHGGSSRKSMRGPASWPKPTATCCARTSSCRPPASRIR